MRSAINNIKTMILDNQNCTLITDPVKYKMGVFGYLENKEYDDI